MMLWKSRGSGPTTHSGRGSRYSGLDEPKRGSDKSVEQDGLSPNSEDVLPLPETQSVRSLPSEQGQQCAGSTPVNPHWLEAQETNQRQEQVRTSGQPNKNGRFSLMKFRHASDPQLSKTYAAASASPPPNLPSKFRSWWLSPTPFRSHRVLIDSSAYNYYHRSYHSEF
jgi:hypothetical protein